MIKTGIKCFLFGIVVCLIFCFSSGAFAQGADAVSTSPLTPQGFFEKFSPAVSSALGGGWESLQQKLIQTVLAITLCYLLIFILVRISNRRIKNLKARHVIRKNIVYIVNISLILFVILIWIRNIGSITIFLGVASAGIALALQEVILSMAGWFLILMRRPFEVGDRIELGGVKGDVIDIRLFQTSLLEIGNWVDADQSTGRIVNVPNSFVFKKEMYNYNRGFEFIWNE